MKNKLIDIIEKNKQPLLYIIFGVLTTAVNIVVYSLGTDICQMHYMLANALAWFLSVLFAFVTNKAFVFESRSWRIQIVGKEIGSFFFARLASGVMDMGLMWLLVDVLSVEEMLAKVGVNVLVIIINYVASKLWIFT